MTCRDPHTGHKHGTHLPKEADRLRGSPRVGVAVSPLPTGFPGDSVVARTRCVWELSVCIQSPAGGPPPLVHSFPVPRTQPQLPGNKVLCLPQLTSLVKSPGSWWASLWSPLDLMKMKANGQSPPKVLERGEMLTLCMGSEDFQGMVVSPLLPEEAQPASPKEGQRTCIHAVYVVCSGPWGPVFLIGNKGTSTPPILPMCHPRNSFTPAQCNARDKAEAHGRWDSRKLPRF